MRGCSYCGLLLVIVGGAAGCAARVTPIGPGFIYEPDEREKRLWATSSENSLQLQASGALYDDPHLQAYLQSILDRLIGEYKNAYLPLKPRVFVLDSESVNAFCLPHGDIYVHTGILGRIRNEAQLTMLLGHELTHATHRHAHQHLKHAYASSGAAAYVSVLAAIGGGNIQNLVSSLSQLMMLASIRGYGRDKEEEADKVGLTLVAQAGYDPHQGAKMFEQMLAASNRKDRGWNFFYATHPKMKSRLKSCKKLLGRLPPALLANAKELGRDRYLDAAIDLIHDEIKRQVVQGKYELADETLTFLGKARPSDPDTHALRGELCRARNQAGDAELARNAYSRALELDCHHAAAHRGLGLLLIRTGEKDDAAEHLEAYIKALPNAADAAIIRQYIDQLTREE